MDELFLLVRLVFSDEGGEERGGGTARHDYRLPLADAHDKSYFADKWGRKEEK